MAPTKTNHWRSLVWGTSASFNTYHYLQKSSLIGGFWFGVDSTNAVASVRSFSGHRPSSPISCVSTSFLSHWSMSHSSSRQTFMTWPEISFFVSSSGKHGIQLVKYVSSQPFKNNKARWALQYLTVRRGCILKAPPKITLLSLLKFYMELRHWFGVNENHHNANKQPSCYSTTANARQELLNTMVVFPTSFWEVLAKQRWGSKRPPRKTALVKPSQRSYHFITSLLRSRFCRPIEQQNKREKKLKLALLFHDSLKGWFAHGDIVIVRLEQPAFMGIVTTARRWFVIF